MSISVFPFGNWLLFAVSPPALRAKVCHAAGGECGAGAACLCDGSSAERQDLCLSCTLQGLAQLKAVYLDLLSSSVIFFSFVILYAFAK